MIPQPTSINEVTRSIHPSRKRRNKKKDYCPSLPTKKEPKTDAPEISLDLSGERSFRPEEEK